ncbi:MAG: hypothetical protein JO153_15055 [Solirubrobacterales bacterium]|nr:hypothetical protein [Solirubrobacterales bacterium]
MRRPFAVLACLASTFAVAGTASLATAAPKQNRGLTINATPNPIGAGEGVLIYGQLNRGPVAGQTISLYHRVGTQRNFTFIQATRTDAFGFYRFTRAEGVVTTNRSWFVRGPRQAHSRTVNEQVAALVSIRADTTSTDTSHAITFSGHLTPTHRFQTVLLQQQIGASDDWQTIETGRLNGGSRYSIAYRWRVPGAHDVRVVLPGDQRNIRSESDAVTVTIEQAQVADFTISSSSPVIPDGATVTISGVLDKAGTTTPQASTSVSLWARQPADGSFKKLEETTTAADGSYSFLEKPSANEIYRVRTTLPANRQTAVLFEGVRDVVSLQASSMSASVGGRILFTGSVTPDKADHRVYLQRLGSDGDWHAVAVTRVRASSTFQFAWVFGRVGTPRFRARIFSDPRNVGGRSNPVSITVAGLAPNSQLPPAS